MSRSPALAAVNPSVIKPSSPLYAMPSHSPVGSPVTPALHDRPKDAALHLLCLAAETNRPALPQPLPSQFSHQVPPAPAPIHHQPASPRISPPQQPHSQPQPPPASPPHFQPQVAHYPLYVPPPRQPYPAPQPLLQPHPHYLYQALPYAPHPHIVHPVTYPQPLPSLPHQSPQPQPPHHHHQSQPQIPLPPDYQSQHSPVPMGFSPVVPPRPSPMLPVPVPVSPQVPVPAQPVAKVKGPWRPEEDKILTDLVAKLGARRWTVIASHIAGRTGKQARERWLNQLSPDLAKRAWTPEEDRIVMEAHARLGNRWSEIAKLLKGRTDNATKNRFNTTIRRQISELSNQARNELVAASTKKSVDGVPTSVVTSSASKCASLPTSPTTSDGEGAEKKVAGKRKRDTAARIGLEPLPQRPKSLTASS